MKKSKSSNKRNISRKRYIDLTKRTPVSYPVKERIKIRFNREKSYEPEEKTNKLRISSILIVCFAIGLIFWFFFVQNRESQSVTINNVAQETVPGCEFIEKLSNPEITANARKDISIKFGELVYLDGSNSKGADTKTDYSSFEWSVFDSQCNRIAHLTGPRQIWDYNSNYTAGNYTAVLKISKGNNIAKDVIHVAILPKTACINSEVHYFPSDTVCMSKWPGNLDDKKTKNIGSWTGFGFNRDLGIHTLDSCTKFEVCSDEIDYIVKDAINCCNKKPVESNLEAKTIESEDGANISLCESANNLENSNGDLKTCLANYIVNGFDSYKKYMQGYMEGGPIFCPNQNVVPCPMFESVLRARYETFPYVRQGLTEDQYVALYFDKSKCGTGWYPIPKSNYKNVSVFNCYQTVPGNNIPIWQSDTNFSLNQPGTGFLPTHVSINYLATGQCFDYSAAVTTMFRKIGFAEDKVMSQASRGPHEYTLVEFDNDSKWYYADAVGNVGGGIVKNPRKGIQGTWDYCNKSILFCENDDGSKPCTNISQMHGC